MLTTIILQRQYDFNVHMRCRSLFCFHKIISLYFKLQSILYTHICNSINITYKIPFHSAILAYITSSHSIAHKPPPILSDTQMRIFILVQFISHISQPILINTQMRIFTLVQYNRGQYKTL